MAVPAGSTQDFLGDELEGPLVFRCNRALVEQALGQFIAGGGVPVPLVSLPFSLKVRFVVALSPSNGSGAKLGVNCCATFRPSRGADQGLCAGCRCSHALQISYWPVVACCPP